MHCSKIHFEISSSLTLVVEAVFYKRTELRITSQIMESSFCCIYWAKKALGNYHEGL